MVMYTTVYHIRPFRLKGLSARAASLAASAAVAQGLPCVFVSTKSKCLKSLLPRSQCDAAD